MAPAIQSKEFFSIQASENFSDDLIRETHWNLSMLNQMNYTLYSNHTLSNESRCILIFETKIPELLPNGTFINGISCYSPFRPIRARAKIGLVFACFFAFSIIYTIVNLRKLAKRSSPSHQKSDVLGARFQWYWALIATSCALTSSIADVDVDRYYLPELPLVLSSIFWHLTVLASICIIWESIRHWGSVLKKRTEDANYSSFDTSPRKYHIEVLFPVLFYFPICLNFLMVFPRRWTNIELQRSPSQTYLRARPFATDIRFKIGAFSLVASWCVICLFLNLLHQQLKLGIHNPDHGLQNRQLIPPRLIILISLSLIMVTYNTVCAFNFTISPMNVHCDLGFMYGLGWGVVALILIIYQSGDFLSWCKAKH
ncbi:unnamed protein product [Blumeria hordei]|uniref:Uncharacterized protein n=1 Tax=Blumeria hordei TaxID=2867405 RepID=A0A383UK58_BLUHO|nr:unnamed protein product [Blumeria hordei]